MEDIYKIYCVSIPEHTGQELNKIAEGKTCTYLNGPEAVLKCMGKNK